MASLSKTNLVYIHIDTRSQIRVYAHKTQRWIIHQEITNKLLGFLWFSRMTLNFASKMPNFEELSISYKLSYTRTLHVVLKKICPKEIGPLLEINNRYLIFS